MPATLSAETNGKTRNILNLSKTGRKFIVSNGAVLAPDQPPMAISETEAEYLLKVLPNHGPRYPELVDADKFSPLSAKAKDALAENARLLKENEELRSQIQPVEETKKSKGGAKK